MRSAPHHSAGITVLAVNKPDPKVLQDFLALKFALSRRTAKAVIDGRSVWVNRKCVWIARFALKTGDLIEVPSNVVKAAKRQGGQGAEGSGAAPGARTGSASRHAARHGRVRWHIDSYLFCDSPGWFVSFYDPSSV